MNQGKQFGIVEGNFRARWWNYYERGLSFMEGGCFEAAVRDFQEAVRQRDKDRWKSRIYGRNFIHYFPHRETGIAYYRMGDPERAVAELEISLKQTPSDKARFYLDLIRKSLIEAGGAAETFPKVVFDKNTAEYITREDPVVVSGYVEDEGYIASLEINGEPFYMEESGKRIRFRQNLNLSQGKNPVRVEAKNLTGNSGSNQIIVHVDREGPKIAVNDLKADSGTGNRVYISGVLADETGVSKLYINSERILIRPGRLVPFSAVFIADGPRIELSAHDIPGNRTSASIPLSSLISMRSQVLLASAGGFPNPVDSALPVIEFRGGLRDNLEVYQEKLCVGVEAADQSGIVEISVNSKPVNIPVGKRLFFDGIIHLQDGKNTIIVEAVNASGKKSCRRITLTRKTPVYLRLEERLSVLVLPFEHKGLISRDSLVFQNHLFHELKNQNRFRMAPYEHVEISRPLNPMNPKHRRIALSLGRKQGVDCVMIGTIIETVSGIEIRAELMDTDEVPMETEAKDVFFNAKSDSILKMPARMTAVKFHFEFPLLSGRVTGCNGKNLMTDLFHDKIKLRRRLIVIQDKTGMGDQWIIRTTDPGIIGPARITKLLPDASGAQLLSGRIDKCDAGVVTK